MTVRFVHKSRYALGPDGLPPRLLWNRCRASFRFRCKCQQTGKGTVQSCANAADGTIVDFGRAAAIHLPGCYVGNACAPVQFRHVHMLAAGQCGHMIKENSPNKKRVDIKKKEQEKKFLEGVLKFLWEQME